jgi:ubiquinone/menaquinone biosynthesis C-methylase UbiE
VTPLCGDLEALPFEDDAFYLVTRFNTFQLAVNPAPALRNAWRVTRSGGMIIIMTWADPVRMEAASLVAAMKPRRVPLLAQAV